MSANLENSVLWFPLQVCKWQLQQYPAILPEWKRKLHQKNHQTKLNIPTDFVYFSSCFDSEMLWKTQLLPNVTEDKRLLWGSWAKICGQLICSLTRSSMNKVLFVNIIIVKYILIILQVLCQILLSLIVDSVHLKQWYRRNIKIEILFTVNWC